MTNDRKMSLKHWLEGEKDIPGHFNFGYYELVGLFWRLKTLKPLIIRDLLENNKIARTAPLILAQSFGLGKNHRAIRIMTNPLDSCHMEKVTLSVSSH